MIIHFLDGGYAECSEIEVVGDQIYWDGYRYYPVYEVDWIEDDDGSDITMDYLGSIYGSTRKFTKYPQGYVKASKSDRKYTAFYNGEIFDVSSDCDALIKQLKAEIDEAIANGDVEDIDFGECWVEDEDEEVMYIADGDSDYAEYL